MSGIKLVVLQVVSIVAACFVLVVLLALGHLLEPLPEACLGAIIMVALVRPVLLFSGYFNLY